MPTCICTQHDRPQLPQLHTLARSRSLGQQNLCCHTPQYVKTEFSICVMSVTLLVILLCVICLLCVVLQASMEILFLEAAMQVLSEYVPEYWQDPHFQSFFKSMLQ